MIVNRFLNPFHAVLLGAASCMALLAAASSAEDGPCLPVPPEQLLKFLPKPPSGWQLTRSEATHDMTDWLTSTAVREYATVNPEGTPAPENPSAVRIRITDTSRHPDYTEAFEDFQVGKHGNTESTIIASYPAHVMTLGEIGSIVDLFVEQRFVLNIRFRNASVEDLPDWLKIIRISAMKAAPGDTIEKLPAKATLVRIDELRPERNQSREAVLVTQAEMEREQAEEDAKITDAP